MPHDNFVLILLISEGRAGEAWELKSEERNVLSDTPGWGGGGGASDRKVLLRCFYVVLKAKLFRSVEED